MGKKRKKNKRSTGGKKAQEQGQNKESSSAPEDNLPVFEGFIDNVEVRPPRRFVYLVFLFFLAILLGFYYLATSEKAAAFLNLPVSDPPPTIRQKVQETLQRVVRLRADSKYDEAYELLQSLHQKYPEEPNLNRELGWHHVEKGLYVFAEEYFDLAAEKVPKNSKLSFYRGELFLRWANRTDDEASRPLLDEDEKHRLIKEAIEQFEKSRTFFQQSLEGHYVFNGDSSKKKLIKATEGWNRSRYKKARLTFIRAKGTFSSNQVLLQETLDDLERMQKEADLSPHMKRQIEILIRDIMKER